MSENVKLRWFILPFLLAALCLTATPPVTSWAGELEDTQEQVRRNPNDANAHYRLGNAYYRLGQYQEAIASYKKVLRINPDQATAHYSLGNAYYRLGQYQEAIASYKKVLRINPDHANAHYNLGVTYQKSGRHQEAIASHKEALRINPDHASAHFNLGWVYDELGQYQEAIASYKEALRIKPNDASAHFNLGVTHKKLGQYQEAIASYKEAIRIKPNDADAHLGLGDSYENVGRNEEAVSEYREVLRINPGLTHIRNRLDDLDQKLAARSHITLDERRRFEELGLNVGALIEAGYSDDEIREFLDWKESELQKKTLRQKTAVGGVEDEIEALLRKEFIELEGLFTTEKKPSSLKDALDLYRTDPKSFSSRLVLGYMYSQIGEYEKSIFYFKEALDFKKDFFDKLISYLNVKIKNDPKVNLYYDQKFKEVLSDLKDHDVFITLMSYALVFNELIDTDPEKVISALKKINASGSNTSSIYASHLAVAAVYAFHKQYEKIILPLEKAANLKPNWVISYILLGITYMELDRKDEAITSLKKVTQLKPEEFYMYLLLGAAYEHVGYNQKAIASFNAARRLSPASALPYFVLGDSYYRLDQYQNAIAAYKNALLIKPDAPDVHNGLGNTYRKLGQHQDAIVSYKKVLLVEPDRASAHFKLGWVYGESGQYQEAIASYKEAIRIKPNDASAHYNLGLIYKKIGQYQEAITSHKEAIRIKPDDADARNNLNELEQMLADERLAREQRLFKEERKKNELLQKIKEADRLARERKLLEEERKRFEAAENRQRQAQAIEETIPQSRSGSGFFISKMGHVITNAHVVQNCNKVTIGDNSNKQVSAEIISTDRSNDLALLKLSTHEKVSAGSQSLIRKLGAAVVPLMANGLLRSEDVRLGEKILVAGYPFGDFFSNTIKVTTGVVSATRGLSDDSGQFQLDAAIQPGNSGGPIYDSGGNIVGVVIAQLDKLMVAEAIGSLPENVNFGIKASTVRQFLTSSGLPSKKSERAEGKSTEQLAGIAQNQALMVMCLR